MEKSIVCGVDGSGDSRAALAVAAAMATRLDAPLVLATVVEPVQSAYVTTCGIGAGGVAPSLAATLGEEVRAAEQLLEEMCEEAGLQEVEQRVVSGFAPERLADLADEENAELIVVGSRGRGAFKAAFMGSVSTNLIGVARCPVLVVPRGASEI